MAQFPWLELGRNDWIHLLVVWRPSTGNSRVKAHDQKNLHRWIMTHLFLFFMFTGSRCTLYLNWADTEKTVNVGQAMCGQLNVICTLLLSLKHLYENLRWILDSHPQKGKTMRLFLSRNRMAQKKNHGSMCAVVLWSQLGMYSVQVVNKKLNTWSNLMAGSKPVDDLGV